jgi:NTP pyrophosphatase (non-canonical NTP hydrolase)
MEKLEKIIVDIIKFRDERGWEKFHSLNHLVSALSIEVAELAELCLWKEDKEIKEDLMNKDLYESFSDEIADIFNYLLLIAYTADIDLIEATRKKLKKNNLKYPISKSFGKSTKYNKLDD